MNDASPRLQLSRRNAIRFLAISGIGTAAYVLYERAPWLDYDERIAPLRRHVASPSTDLQRKRELVRYATLAASGHNAQPWRFVIGAETIDILPDYARRLPVVDPHDRELWMSLGCALENLLVAARAAGYLPEVTYPDEAQALRVQLSPAATHGDPLFDAIPFRQNTRSAYDGRLIPVADLGQLASLPSEPGVLLQLYTGSADREHVLEYVSQGNRRQYADPAFVDELIAWLRFNRREALASLDGLFSPSSGNPEVPRWIGELVVGGTKPEQQVDVDVGKLRSSPAAIVIASERDDPAAWVRTGQVYERLALRITELGITSALLNQPIEVPELRGEFQRAMGLGGSRPQLLLRIGYAAPMPRSPRRVVEDVIEYAGQEPG